MYFSGRIEFSLHSKRRFSFGIVFILTFFHLSFFCLLLFLFAIALCGGRKHVPGKLRAAFCVGTFRLLLCVLRCSIGMFLIFANGWAMSSAGFNVLIFHATTMLV